MANVPIKVCQRITRFASRDRLVAGYIMLAYGLAFTATWWLSKELEVVPGAVSWFITAGVRLAALALTPPRRWWWLWLAECIASQLLTNLDFEFQNFTTEIAALVLPLPAYALPLWWLTRSRQPVPERSWVVPDFGRLVLAALSGAAIQGLFWSSNLISNGFGNLSDQPLLMLGIALGDLVGICLVLPAVLMLRERAWQLSVLLMVLFCTSLPLLVVWLFEPGGHPYYWRIFLMLVVGFSAQRYGVVGACLASWSTSVMVVAAQFQSSPLGSVQEDQFFIIFLTFGGLALGAAVSSQRALIRQLAASNRELRRLNREHQDLTVRLVDAGEVERKRIAREIHDGLGQLLSTIRVKLQLLKRQTNADSASLDRLDELVGSTYETARSLMYELSPSGLLEMGIEAALRSPGIEDMLKSSGIRYQVKVQLHGVALSEPTRLHLFRIVQEASNNTAKYAAAQLFEVTLKLENNALQLLIEDDGRGFDPATVRAGQGLANIRDRVAVLGGDYQLISGPNGTRHEISVGL